MRMKVLFVRSISMAQINSAQEVRKRLFLRLTLTVRNALLSFIGEHCSQLLGVVKRGL